MHHMRNGWWPSCEAWLVVFYISFTESTLFSLYLGIHMAFCLFSIANPIIFWCTKQKCIELLEMPTLYLHSCQIHCLQSRCYFYHMLSRKQLPRAMIFKKAAIIFQICVLSSWQVCQSVCLGSSFIFPALAMLWSDLRASMWQTLSQKKKKSSETQFLPSFLAFITAPLGRGDLTKKSVIVIREASLPW